MTDIILHALGGALIALIASLVDPFWTIVAIPVAFAAGVARESGQRDWISPLQFSAHAWREAVAWSVGAAAIAVLVHQ